MRTRTKWMALVTIGLASLIGSMVPIRGYHEKARVNRREKIVKERIVEVPEQKGTRPIYEMTDNSIQKISLEHLLKGKVLEDGTQTKAFVKVKSFDMQYCPFAYETSVHETADTGLFTIPLPRGTYNVFAVTKSGAMGVSKNNQVPGEAVVIEADNRVSLEIIAENDVELEKASIHAVSSPRDIRVEQLPKESGAFRIRGLPQGFYVLLVQRRDKQVYHGVAIDNNCALEEQVIGSHNLFRVKARGKVTPLQQVYLHGSVSDDKTGRLIKDTHITIRDLEFYEEQQVTTDSNGKFMTETIRSPKLFEIVAEGYQTEIVDRRPAIQNIENFRLRRNRGFKGEPKNETPHRSDLNIVVNDGRNPVQGAQVVVHPNRLSPEREWRVTDKEGNCSIQSLPSGEYVVIATASGYVEQQKLCKIDKTQRIDIEMLQGYTLVGSVIDENRFAVSDADIHVVGENNSLTAKTNRHGVFHLGPIKGRYQYLAIKGKYERAGEIDIAHDEHMTITFQPLKTYKITVLDKNNHEQIPYFIAHTTFSYGQRQQTRSYECFAMQGSFDIGMREGISSLMITAPGYRPSENLTPRCQNVLEEKIALERY